jgi:hypothetical protein
MACRACPFFTGTLAHAGDERMKQSQAQTLVAQAVCNNAIWCHTVCRAHGHAGEFLEGIWLTRRAAPLFYPNAVTLADDQAATAQLAAIQALIRANIPGAWAVKDSFATLDLAPLGFRLLFDAAWIARSSTQALPAADIAGVRWRTVQSAAELRAWEIAWRGVPMDAAEASPPIFLPALLADETVAILAAYRDHQIIAGAIVNRTDEVVGLSNVFVPTGNDAAFRAGCVIAVMERFPDLPIVGYESGGDLAAFGELGFQELGPLRIWLRAADGG